jgi:UTP:GlnB (protein PII) uridylyltransferase
MKSDRIVEKIQRWRGQKPAGEAYLDHPTKDRAESLELLESFPIRLPRRDYQRFINGFSREYLLRTRRRDLIKHYLLFRRFRDQGLITLLSQQSDAEWHLTLMSPDHPFLFSQVSGLLTSKGMDIRMAEAFTHSTGFALDHFLFLDKKRTLRNSDTRKNFQAVLERYLGTDSLPEDLLPAEKQFELFEPDEVAVDIVQIRDLRQTALSVECPDRQGLLFRVSTTLSRLAINIDSAFIETANDRAHDLFLMTRSGKRIPRSRHAALVGELTKRLVKAPG